MRVTSSLADIEFRVGEISRQGDSLVISSGVGSTIDTQIHVSPQDARATLRQVLLSRAAWTFLLGLLVPSSQTATVGDEEVWQARRQGTGVNKPW